MMSNLDSVLDDCLERIADGETLQSCFARYPEQAAELKPLLHAAARLENQAVGLRPSTAFKSRTRAKLYAHMDTHPHKSLQWWKSLLPISRLAFGLAALLLAFVMTGTVLAQSALPGAAFYPWKLASEQAWRTVSPDPVGFDLSLVERRVDEAMAVSGNPTAEEAAIKEYRRAVTDLKSYQDVAVQARIQQALNVQQGRLESAGLLPANQDQETPIPTDVVLPTAIPTDAIQATPVPVSTQQILPLPKQTLIPSVVVPTHVIPTVIPTIIKIPSLLPTKIQIPSVVPTTVQIIPTVVLPTIIKLPSLIPPLPTIPGLP